MQPQENPARVLLGLHGNSTQGLLLKNLFCLECTLKHSVYVKHEPMFHKPRSSNGQINNFTLCVFINTKSLHVHYLPLI